jgi:hypothetical protein
MDEFVFTFEVCLLQMGVSKGKTNMADLKSKFSDVLDEIGIPVQV